MPSTAAKHKAACKKFRVAFIDKHGYVFCESCKRSDRPCAGHHLYYASLWPRHPQLHNPLNLYMLCQSCHTAFHAGERKEEFRRLEEERGLKELFACTVSK